MLKIVNLSKRFKECAALQNINMEIGSGEIVGLLGPNGSGKTTLLRIISKLAFPDRGRVELGGAWNDSVGATLEGQSFLPSLSGFRNLELICRYNELSLKKIDQVNAWLKMDSFLHKPYKSYSTGMKKKLDLACVFLAANDFFLLDEPTNGLDLDSIILFKELILRLAERGKTFFISSHISGHLEGICTRFVFLKDGRLVKTVCSKDLRSGYKDLEEAYKKFIGTVSLPNLH